MIFENTCLGMYKIRVALLALCCDVLAARKCGGFAGHSARKGCNKCFKTFFSRAFGSKPDFSGFDKENWEKRSNELHRIHAESILRATNPAQLKNIVWETGAKYTTLLQLPYYDAVRFVVIDPMHNLFLGIAKSMFKLWSKEGLLNDKDFKILQKRADAVTPPPEIGKIPSKIATGFSGFTADQWKNWVCYYSVFALKGILPTKHYNVWLHFVNACRLICSKCITSEEYKQAEANILEFCKSAEKLYGKKMCTPNMHLSCHFVDCIIDYGPVYSFWCFSFERYNGILGSYHMNNHNISIQLMRKFLRENALLQIQFPEEHSQFKELISVSQTGTVGEVNTPYHNIDDLEIIPHPPIKRVALNNEDAFHITTMYQDIYPNSQINVLRLCDSYSRAKIAGRIIRCTSNGCVYAQFIDGEERPCKVKRFFNHVVIKRDGKKKMITHVI